MIRGKGIVFIFMIVALFVLIISIIATSEYLTKTSDRDFYLDCIHKTGDQPKCYEIVKKGL